MQITAKLVVQGIFTFSTLYRLLFSFLHLVPIHYYDTRGKKLVIVIACETNIVLGSFIFHMVIFRTAFLYEFYAKSHTPIDCSHKNCALLLNLYTQRISYEIVRINVCSISCVHVFYTNVIHYFHLQIIDNRIVNSILFSFYYQSTFTLYSIENTSPQLITVVVNDNFSS